MSTVERVRRTVGRLGALAPPESTRIGYLLRLSRPRFWLYLAGPVIVGVVYAADAPADLFSPVAVALFAYFLVPANVFLYGVNDVFDADIDAANPKKDDREVRYSGDRGVLWAVLTSGLLGLAFVPVLPTSALAAFAAFGFLAVAYSAPPLRFKTTPPLDSVSNGLYVLPGVVGYIAVADAVPPLAAVFGGWLWTMGMHTFSAIPDIEPDREAGIRTTATALGERRTYAYCGACWLAAAAAFWLVHPFFTLLLLAYPVLVFAIARSSVAVERAYWWYPAVNTLVGIVMTLGGIWTLIYGG
ncbi:prenyltransferase [Halococcus saccharolyticus]|uniref:Prenyltransferase n=1 Tax=Halococcus saccharolyticus DSM 5350 TaxID=1227455 RepID=M0MJ38_9EURY|nr:prenyltransferase [Halococcus saccharolyticus]EMA44450.1 prenyltransferase [Halococcus saccharolyticus DSM 5350]